MLLTAFLIGFAGSAHCLLMCGPLLTQLHLQGGRRLLLHHGGRLTAYLLLGLLAAMAGKGLRLVAIQQYITIGAGVMMLAAVAGQLFLHHSRGGFFARSINKLIQGMLHSGKGLPRPARTALFGFANGLMPCGLSYAAAIAAVAMPSAELSLFYMLLFWAGTMPALVALNLGMSKISISLPHSLRQALLITVALLVVVRGLGLGIPYVSPKVETHSGKPECCRVLQ